LKSKDEQDSNLYIIREVDSSLNKYANCIKYYILSFISVINETEFNFQIETSLQQKRLLLKGETIFLNMETVSIKLSSNSLVDRASSAKEILLDHSCQEIEVEASNVDSEI